MKSGSAVHFGPLRSRADAELVEIFRAGDEDAFRAIHDRYRSALLAYSRQMLSQRQDAEDVIQDVFVRAYVGLRGSEGELALKPWLYRVAHNRCIDQLRRPAPPHPALMEAMRGRLQDPIAHADNRESLRHLLIDVRRLPHQQRSALLMRELGGMAYSDIAQALGASVPAVKSLLSRARGTLAEAGAARNAPCSQIRETLLLAREHGGRPNATAKRHMRDCAGCRQFQRQLRRGQRWVASLLPHVGPLAVLGKLGLAGWTRGTTATTAGGAVGATGTAGQLGAFAALGGSMGHVAALLAAGVVAVGGAMEASGGAPHLAATAKRPQLTSAVPTTSVERPGRAAVPHISRPTPAPALISKPAAPLAKPRPAPPAVRSTARGLHVPPPARPAQQRPSAGAPGGGTLTSGPRTTAPVPEAGTALPGSVAGHGSLISSLTQTALGSVGSVLRLTGVLHRAGLA